jgi:hypothetical protein
MCVVNEHEIFQVFQLGYNICNVTQLVVVPIIVDSLDCEYFRTVLTKVVTFGNFVVTMEAISLHQVKYVIVSLTFEDFQCTRVCT